MSWREWLRLAALAVLWGLPYLFVAVALDELTPSAIVLARVGIAAAILVPVAWSQGLLRTLGTDIWRLTVVAILDVVAPFLLIAVAQQAITSSLAGVLVASVPLFVVGLGRWLQPSNEVGWLRGAGFLLGFGGVVVLFGVDLRGGAFGLLGGLAVLAASACYATAALMVKRWFDNVSAVVLTAAVVVIATIVVIPVAVLETEPTWPTLRTSLAILALGSASTAAAFLLFYRLVQQAGADRASLATYLAPAVAVLAGVLFLREEVTITTLLGLGMILIGSAVAGRLAHSPG